MKYLILSLSVVALMSSCKSGGQQENKNASMGEMPATATVQSIKDGQRVFFANMKDGDVVTSPFTVEFGVEGMTVAPAGEVVEGQGHHHLLIGHDAIPAGEMIPAGDSTMIHFGKGQTSTELSLTPGVYKLTLQFANGAHMSYGPAMSASIEVTVKGAAEL